MLVVQTPAEAVAASCRELGGEALVCQADVSQDADCRRLVAQTLAQWGRIDALVNNAGTTKFVAHGDLEGLDEADFHNIYGVNVIGAFQMVRAARAALTASGCAAVVNVASIAGVKGVGSSIAYAASKGALITMTMSLARVLGPEIRVNAVCPGFIEGEWLAEGMGQAVYDQTRAYLRAKTPAAGNVHGRDGCGIDSIVYRQSFGRHRPALGAGWWPFTAITR
jgi:3-oxoacyl-[acyl-carrier protein] reductase